MKAWWRVSGILAILLMAVPCLAQDSVKRAVADQYRIYVDDLKLDSSPSFEELYKTLVSWNPLQKQVAYERASRTTMPGPAFESRGGALVTVRIESIRVEGGQAIVIVNKRVGGAFGGDMLYRKGEANGSLRFKHVWRDTGDGWRLVTSIPQQGRFDTASNPYPARKRVFNPNKAFSKPDVHYGEVTDH